jgi:hypothetical protein
MVKLREMRNGEFRSYGDVGEQFLDHLLETNQVWMLLGGQTSCIRDHSFAWQGSHRARLPYVAPGVGGRRSRVLIPDAIIEPKAIPLRVFLELDRSTEPITERRGRRSIVAKLKAYRRALLLPQPGRRTSAYVDAYPDGREARVLFVLSRDPRGRRRGSIESVADQVGAGLDVRVLPLSDEEPIRSVCLGLDDRLGLERKAEQHALWIAHQHLYCAAVRALKAANVGERHGTEFRSAARRVRGFLESPEATGKREAGREIEAFQRRALRMLDPAREREQWPQELTAALRRLRRLSPNAAARIEPRAVAGGESR